MCISHFNKYNSIPVRLDLNCLSELVHLCQRNSTKKKKQSKKHIYDPHKSKKGKPVATPDFALDHGTSPFSVKSSTCCTSPTSRILSWQDLTSSQESCLPHFRFTLSLSSPSTAAMSLSKASAPVESQNKSSTIWHWCSFMLSLLAKEIFKNIISIAVQSQASLQVAYEDLRRTKTCQAHTMAQHWDSPAKHWLTAEYWTHSSESTFAVAMAIATVALTTFDHKQWRRNNFSGLNFINIFWCSWFWELLRPKTCAEPQEPVVSHVAEFHQTHPNFTSVPALS